MLSQQNRESNTDDWTLVIKPKTGWFDINLRELWQYRDLVCLFVKRNYSSMYKQTILGPLWFIISPLITVLIFTVVFGNIAKIPTDGMPQFLFYMAGNTLWSYFSYCMNSTATTFTSNSVLFGKVYFPRLTMPLSTVIFGFISFLIQLALFLGFVLYYTFTGSIVCPNIYILITPLLVLQVALLGLGFGIIISSLTTKYRDLTILVSFGIQLWMYATPIVYPISGLSDQYKFIIMLNPMSSIVETFRYAFLGSGSLPLNYLLYSSIVTIIVLGIGIVIFSKVEKTFIDTV
ncbi:MAG: ABC transporter permease [Herbinix sp.]|nr:ABC transporter permease [Herbinix sp.]